MSNTADASRPRPIEGPVHYHVTDIGGAKHFLAGFCSGDHRDDPDAEEVDLTAAALVAGGTRKRLVQLPGGLTGVKTTVMGPQTVIVLHDQRNDRLGFASIEIEDPQVDGGTFINVYGREKRLKGRPLADGTTTIGDGIMRAVIEESTDATGDRDTPAIYALTRVTNGLSHAVLERFLFKLRDGERATDGLGNEQSDATGPIYEYKFPSGSTLIRSDQLWRREAGLALPNLPESVYVGRSPVEPAETAPPPEMSRNSLCFCGSGKKYKKCCEPGAADRSPQAGRD